MGCWKYESTTGVFLIWGGKSWHAAKTAQRAGLVPVVDLRWEATQPVLEGVGRAGQEALRRQGATDLYTDYRGGVFYNGSTIRWQDPHGLGGKKHSGAVQWREPGGSYAVLEEGQTVIASDVLAGGWT